MWQQLSSGAQITLIIMGGFVALGALAAVGYLVYAQRDASAILNLVNLLISGLAFKAASEARAGVQQVREQTNGTQTKLIDAMLPKS